MPDYRAYIVGSDGRFVGVHEIAAANREEAAKIALKYVDGQPVELWEGGAWIATLKPSPTGGLPTLKRLPRKREPKA